ncbi:MAG: TRIC cation channel family protein, partial [Iamia sp.]
MLVEDAIGLAAFSIVGVDVALEVGVSPLTAALLGVVSGVGGGVWPVLVSNTTVALVPASCGKSLARMSRASCESEFGTLKLLLVRSTSAAAIGELVPRFVVLTTKPRTNSKGPDPGP